QRTLFFHHSDSMRDLHSFPTRRSSDLRIHWFVLQIHLGKQTGNNPETTVAKSTAESRMIFNRKSDDRGGVQIVIDHTARCVVWRDRKSTRLNSSHVSISYAVFCLKKKI